MKLGFVGLGKMGTAMAGRLLGENFHLGVYNRTASKCAPLAERGATVLESVKEAAGFGDLVISMVENDAALHAITNGPGGLLDNLPQGGVHVLMGTHSLAAVKALHEAHVARGQQLVSAPVLGRPPAAEAGQLGIIAAGDQAAIARCAPLFEAMGRRTYNVGADPIAAAAAKIANNFVLACAIEALGEGFALGRKCGLRPEAFQEILTDGLFGSPAYKIYGQLIADQKYFDAPGFSATTGLKDVLLALSAGEALAVPLPSANVCRDHLLNAIANGHGDADWSVMAHVQARASGLDLLND